MKRFAVVLCIMFLFVGIAEAKIYKKTDDFNGSIAIISERTEYVKSKESFLLEEFTFQLIKAFPKNEDPAIILKIYKQEDNWWFFSDSEIEFKIDENIYKTSKAVTDSQITNSSYKHLHTSAFVVIDNSLSEKIVSAEKVTIRYYFNNHQSITYDVSDNVLKEWKEVINSTKDWEKSTKKQTKSKNDNLVVIGAEKAADSMK